MKKTITITSSNAIDAEMRAECLQYLANNATTEELIKLKKLAENPAMRALLKNF